MKTYLVLPVLLISFAANLMAQVPVTVNRSTINSGGLISLPSFTRTVTANLGPQTTMTFSGGVCFDPGGAIGWQTASGSVSSTPTTITGNTINTFTVTASPSVVISTNAPSVFTNSISAFATYTGGGLSANTPTINQSYAVTVINDVGGGSAAIQTGTLTGLLDSLVSISRKDTSAVWRKLIGFQLKATTNTALTSFAVSLSNTSTNGSSFTSLGFFQDTDGDQEFETTDIIIRSTTNANNFAVFNNLNIGVYTNNTTFFVAGIFQPSLQSRNSFISASLKAQSILMQLIGTNVVIQTTGSSIIGKQYAFLDTTTDEDAQAALALTNQINSSVNSATNSLSSQFSSNLAGATNSLSGQFSSDLVSATNSLSGQIGQLSSGFNSALDSATNSLTASLSSSFESQIASATNGLGNLTNTTILQKISSSPISIPIKKPSFMDAVLPAAAAGAAGIGAAFTSDALNKGSLSPEFSPPSP